ISSFHRVPPCSRCGAREPKALTGHGKRIDTDIIVNCNYRVSLIIGFSERGPFMKEYAARRTAIFQSAIVIAELFGTCLWFSAAAVSPEIGQSLGYRGAEPLDLSSAVQVGFVVGTLLIGLTGFADRFLASRIFVGFAPFW